MSSTKIVYIGNMLSRHGFTPTVIETLSVQLRAEMYSVIAASHKKNKVLRLAHIAYMLLRHKNAKLVLIDTYSTSAFKFAKLAGSLASKLKIPYIPILHGGNLPRRLEKNNPGDNHFFSMAARLVAPSSFLFEQFKQKGFKHVVYIPNNIDLEKYRYKKRQNLRPRLLWVRSFHKVYNCSMALQVLRLLLKEYPDATLCMVGPDKDGSLAEAKQLALNFGIADRVTFTGKLSQPEWHKLSEDYDIFINTTNVDNTPVSVIEAMALGLPVISTNVGGIPFLLQHEHNALLVSAGNAGEMTSQAIRLLTTPNLVENLYTNARKTVGGFGWNTVKHEWNALLKEVVGN